MAKKYDAIVIGTGQAGPSLAVRLADTGMKVAIIERKRFGGTCVNNGCIPTKTLVASARTAHVARRAGDYGVTIRSVIAVDMKKVKMRKDAVVRQSSQGVENWLKNTQNLTVYEGHARFADAHFQPKVALHPVTLHFQVQDAHAVHERLPGLRIDFPRKSRVFLFQAIQGVDQLLLIGGGFRFGAGNCAPTCRRRSYYRRSGASDHSRAAPPAEASQASTPPPGV